MEKVPHAVIRYHILYTILFETKKYEPQGCSLCILGMEMFLKSNTCKHTLLEHTLLLLIHL